MSAGSLHRALAGLDHRQRRAVVWIIALMLGIVVGWPLLGTYFIIGTTTIGTPLVAAYFAAMIFLCNMAYFGDLAAGLKPWAPTSLPPIPVTRRLYRRGAVVFVVLTLTTCVVMACAVWAAQWPPVLTGATGTPTVFPDGRLALIDRRGDLIRHISAQEYERRKLIGGRVGMTVLALIGGVVFLAAAARRRWIPMDRALLDAVTAMARDHRTVTSRRV